MMFLDYAPVGNYFVQVFEIVSLERRNSAAARNTSLIGKLGHGVLRNHDSSISLKILEPFELNDDARNELETRSLAVASLKTRF
jgi:hypothetical protein